PRSPRAQSTALTIVRRRALRAAFRNRADPHAAASFARARARVVQRARRAGQSSSECAVSQTGRPPTKELEVLLEAAIAKQAAGRIGDAEALCQRAVQRAPQHPDALHLLGVISLQTGRLDEGVGYIRKSLLANPRQPFALTNMALALARLGRHEDS